jgi:outer membrane biosynthesis protein TonB
MPVINLRLTTIALSVAIHLLLLWVLMATHTPQKLPTQNKQPIINAKLLFLPQPKPEEKTITKEETKPQQEKSENKQKQQATVENTDPVETISKEEPKQTPAQKTNTSQPEATLMQAPSNAKSTSYNPYAGITSILQQDTQQLLDSVSTGDMPAPTIKSINSTDDPAVDEIFETQHRISPTQVVVIYNGQCVLIERKLDHNGFSYNSWSGFSGNCGQNDAMKQQFKLSMDKFLKPKKWD